MLEGWHRLREPHERLRWARQQAGYEDAVDAAGAMGVRESTYLGHENGSRGLNRAAKRYADFFKISLDWLLAGKGAPQPRMLEPSLEEIWTRLTPAQRKQGIRLLKALADEEAS